MKVLVLDSDYLHFLASLYADGDLARTSFEAQLDARRAALFGTAPSYASAFRSCGHESEELFINNAPLQLAWGREHGVTRGLGRLRARDVARQAVGARRGIPRFLVPGTLDRDAMADVLIAQVEAFGPDVILNQDVGGVGPATLAELKARTGFLIGQYAASPLPSDEVLGGYDLVISSFLPTVDELRERGHRAELSRLGFDAGVLTALGPAPPVEWGLTFVGSLAPIHSSRLHFLEELAELVPDLRIWSPDPIPRGSTLRGRNEGAMWGRGMYEVLRSSRATVNHHGDIAAYANNLRLFEATGVGTVLLTDDKPNLADLFQPGVELLAYASASDCAEAYAALDDASRASLAAAGQKRTLRDHDYRDRVREILELSA